MQLDAMREQPRGALHSISSRCLHENMTLSWRGMEAVHLKIPMQFLLGYLHLRTRENWDICSVDICIYVFTYIISLSTHTYIYIHVHQYDVCHRDTSIYSSWTYAYVRCHGQEQGRKGRGKEVSSDDCKVVQLKRNRLGHFVFGK